MSFRDKHQRLHLSHVLCEFKIRVMEHSQLLDVRRIDAMPQKATDGACGRIVDREGRPAVSPQDHCRGDEQCFGNAQGARRERLCNVDMDIERVKHRIILETGSGSINVECCVKQGVYGEVCITVVIAVSDVESVQAEHWDSLPHQWNAFHITDIRVHIAKKEVFDARIAREYV